MQETSFNNHIHLLYVPTLACNLDCRYCYLGEQTSSAILKRDRDRAVSTLRHALESFLVAGVMPFNVSLHGGEPTMLPPAVLNELFTIIRRHYLDHFDQLSSRGFKKSYPHIKTNLYNFHKLYDLFDHHKVSISASIDLPLSLHERYRTTKGGKSWLKKTIENLRLLARYPHATKISSTLYREHLEDIPALIADIWKIHREIGFDMNNFNFMFGFETDTGNRGDELGLRMVADEMQVRFYEAMREEFFGTELAEGFRRNWFDEFKPSYCTNSFNCGERFFLLQSDGEIYSCVRGQGLADCRYGNILNDSVQDILAAGRSKVCELHQKAGLDEMCRKCDYLHICHTGCPAVKRSSKINKSYTCALQKTIYVDNPCSYPPAATQEEQQRFYREYAFGMHPAMLFEGTPQGFERNIPRIVLPNDINHEKNALSELIAVDQVLAELYSEQAVVIEINSEQYALRSQIMKTGRDFFSVRAADRIRLHLRRSIFEAGCDEPVRNTLCLQMLRDTAVVYGDEQRSKQEHLFTYQLFYNLMQPSSMKEGFVMADISQLLLLHREMYLKEVMNNMFVTTGYLRDYHYQKQKANAFYHIQAINLPFQNFEFYWDE